MSTRSMRNKRKKLRKKRRRQHNYEGADRLLGENVRAKLQRTEGNTSLPPETPSAPSLTRQQQDANSLDALFRTSTELTLSQVGERALSWLLRPVTVERFLSEYYETKPLLVRAKSNKPVGSLLSKEVIFAWIKEGKLNLSEDLTLTRYVDGSRETVTPSDPSTADFDYIRDMYAKQQCSLRLLRPSQFSDALYRIVASLEAFFCCCGGSNAYLTPAGSQGFAPHYDDIDAFVVQVEGRKTWTVYRPYKGEDEQLRQLFPRLPRHSSADFTQDQVAQLHVAYETELCPGDVLYLPRGVVHQAKAPTDTHSLHVTISTGQKNTWGDLLAMALPNVIQGVIRYVMQTDLLFVSVYVLEYRVYLLRRLIFHYSDGNKDTEHLRRRYVREGVDKAATQRINSRGIVCPSTSWSSWASCIPIKPITRAER